MKIFTKYAVRYFVLACTFFFSSNLYAAAPLLQKIILNYSAAQLDPAIPLTVVCPTCMQTTKQDDHTYYVTYMASSKTDDGKISFVYYYGDNANDSNACIYDANVKFTVDKSGRFYAAYNYPATLDQKSTSKSCPPKLSLFAYTEGATTSLNIEY